MNNIIIEYGNTIYSDNTVSKRTIYKFDKLEELQTFWEEREVIEGTWQGQLDMLKITHTVFVSSEEYFTHQLGEEE